jgi:hypothetical protein
LLLTVDAVSRWSNRRETGMVQAKIVERQITWILATGLINRALAGLDFRSSVAMWRGSYRRRNSFNQRLSQIGLGRTPATHEQRSPTVYSKFLVVGPIRFWSRGKYRVHRASWRRLRTVEQRRQLLARGRPGLHTMEQWSHMCSRRRRGMRSVEQRRVLCARGRFSLFSLEQRFPLRGGRGRGVC